METVLAFATSDAVITPLAVYGAWVLLGFPYTDEVTALGRKILVWARDKVGSVGK